MPEARNGPRRLLALVKRSLETQPAIGVADEARPDPEQILRRLDWQVVRRLDGLLQGDYRSLFTGQGLDLAEIREYQPGDDVRLIDWNVTARTHVTHVRRYLEDREITAWLLLDTSGSVDFGTAKQKKRDLVVEFAAAVARLLTRRGNRVGALLFAGRVDELIPPRGGRQQVLSLIHRLTRPDRRSSPGLTDLGDVLNRAAQTIRRRSLVFVVSDFIARPGWEGALRRLAQRHEVVAVWVRDPREEAFPNVGPLTLEDAETGEQLQIDTRDRGFRERFAAHAADRQQRLSRALGAAGVDLLTLSTDGDLLADLTRFAQRRRLLRGVAAGP